MSSINVLRQAIASAAVHDWEEAQTLVAKQRRRIDHSIARNAPLTRQYANHHTTNDATRHETRLNLLVSHDTRRMSKQLEHYRETFRRRGRQQAAPGYIPPVRIGFREEAEMSAFCTPPAPFTMQPLQLSDGDVAFVLITRQQANRWRPRGRRRPASSSSRPSRSAPRPRS